MLAPAIDRERQSWVYDEKKRTLAEIPDATSEKGRKRIR